MDMQAKKLIITIPCYNEEESLPKSIPVIQDILVKIIEKNLVSKDSFILLIDDGSRDKTWSIIQNQSVEFKHVQGIKLSGNRGHQFALLAGLEFCIDKCDYTLSMDVDLQDDPNVIEEFVQKALSGSEIVYGVRSSREMDTFYKKVTAEYFYKVMLLLGVKIVFNHADYRLASNRALKFLSEFKETHLFLRGIFPHIGLKSDVVYYKRFERIDGESKYSTLKMLSFAWNGITSFSIKPLRLISVLGFVCFFITLLLSAYTLISYMRGTVIPGWTSLILSIYFIGSVQLLSLGIIGEYIGKIFIEAKKRPRYFISESTSSKN